MSRSTSVRSYRLGTGTEPTRDWPSVDVDALKEDSRALFLRRRQGIVLYDGATNQQIRLVICPAAVRSDPSQLDGGQGQE
jgi:hypothetical protein